MNHHKHLNKRFMVCSQVFLLLVMLPLLFGTIASAQDQQAEKVVQFKDGSTVTGKIVEMDIHTIKIQTTDGSIVTRKFDDITSVQNRDEIITAKSLLPVHSIEIGFEAFYKTYYEPDVMNEKGMMYGVHLAYTYHDKVMAKGQLIVASGSVDYDSNNTGSISGISDNQWEIRGLLGYDFAVDPKFFVTPYIGLGYRYLGDDSSGKISTNSFHGYNRQSNYWYSPVGIEFTKILAEGWTIGAGGEFDIFWSGTQKSFLSNANPSYPDVSNQQNQGYGIRGSIRVEKKFTYAAILVEPFIRYWNIGQSDTYTSATFSGYEPKNNTTEYGALVGIKF